ncbi:hypothetical protein HaLaN_13201 [Haematococcus lacustris]|uniref:Uncharacterized protein n=1 Tax=Haematococcus lacustris TaxID=44745 RepID=A0A699ZLR8_HAELA|nr:hypothetical protein HaLaN_13201 [Haematococcus lacustris]
MHPVLLTVASQMPQQESQGHGGCMSLSGLTVTRTQAQPGPGTSCRQACRHALHVPCSCEDDLQGYHMPADKRKEILELGLPDDGYDYLQHLQALPGSTVKASAQACGAPAQLPSPLTSLGCVWNARWRARCQWGVWLLLLRLLVVDFFKLLLLSLPYSQRATAVSHFSCPACACMFWAPIAGNTCLDVCCWACAWPQNPVAGMLLVPAGLEHRTCSHTSCHLNDVLVAVMAVLVVEVAVVGLMVVLVMVVAVMVTPSGPSSSRSVPVTAATSRGPGHGTQHAPQHPAPSCSSAQTHLNAPEPTTLLTAVRLEAPSWQPPLPDVRLLDARQLLLQPGHPGQPGPSRQVATARAGQGAGQQAGPKAANDHSAAAVLNSAANLLVCMLRAGSSIWCPFCSLFPHAVRSRTLGEVAAAGDSEGSEGSDLGDWFDSFVAVASQPPAPGATASQHDPAAAKAGGPGGCWARVGLWDGGRKGQSGWRAFWADACWAEAGAAAAVGYSTDGLGQGYGSCWALVGGVVSSGRSGSDSGSTASQQSGRASSIQGSLQPLALGEPLAVSESLGLVGRLRRVWYVGGVLSPWCTRLLVWAGQQDGKSGARKPGCTFGGQQAGGLCAQGLGRVGQQAGGLCAQGLGKVGQHAGGLSAARLQAAWLWAAAVHMWVSIGGGSKGAQGGKAGWPVLAGSGQPRDREEIEGKERRPRMHQRGAWLDTWRLMQTVRAQGEGAVNVQVAAPTVASVF